MDIVITYVNGLDPLWQQDYQQHTNIPILEKRFRDWIKKNYKWVFIVATGAKLVSGMGMYLYATNKKRTDIKTQTVAQEYKSQKAKTVNLTDSINQKTK